MELLPLSLLLPLQDAPAATPAPGLLNSPLFPLVLVGALFVFLLYLPEKKKQKQRAAMLEALKKGDRVMTASGIFGTVVTTSSEVVVLQVADNVRMRFTRGAIQNVLEAEKDAVVEEKAEPSKA